MFNQCFFNPYAFAILVLLFATQNHGTASQDNTENVQSNIENVQINAENVQIKEEGEKSNTEDVQSTENSPRGNKRRSITNGEETMTSQVKDHEIRTTNSKKSIQRIRSNRRRIRRSRRRRRRRMMRYSSKQRRAPHCYLVTTLKQEPICVFSFCILVTYHQSHFHCDL